VPLDSSSTNVRWTRPSRNSDVSLTVDPNGACPSGESADGAAAADAVVEVGALGERSATSDRPRGATKASGETCQPRPARQTAFSTTDAGRISCSPASSVRLSSCSRVKVRRNDRRERRAVDDVSRREFGARILG